MRFQNALDNARLAILMLLAALVLSFLINLFLGWGLIEAPKKLTVHIPPQIPDSGMTLKAHEMPKTAVYAFAYYIWQRLNNWPTNGAEEYAHNVKQFSPYLTPSFRQYLENNEQVLYRKDELQDRIRLLTGVNGSRYMPADVHYIGHGTWLVHLTMRMKEWLNEKAHNPSAANGLVKDVEYSYILRVVRYSANEKSNQWGLALDGFEVAPRAIKVFV